jgi:nucleoside-diphosphate kinase
MYTTDVMIKPDGVQRRLIGKIIGRFEDKGLTLKAMKLTTPTSSMLQKHYEHLRDMPIFPSLLKFMSSGPVVAMVSPVRICSNVVLIGPSVNRYGKGETR